MVERAGTDRLSCRLSVPDRMHGADDRTDPPVRTGSSTTSASRSRRRSVLIGTAGIAAAAGVGIAYTLRGLPDDDHETDSLSWERDPNLIAHRGFAGENPENTIAAVDAATTDTEATGQRADLIEIDVVPTANDDVVVFHDDGLSERDDGLTDANGIVWDTDTETVTSAEVLDSGETVPLLTEILDAIPSTVGVNIELKNPGSTELRFAEKLPSSELAEQKELWRPFVDRVLEIADEYDNEILLSSFYEAALAISHERSTYPIAPLFWGSMDDGLEIARTYDASAIHPPISMIQGTPFFDKSNLPAIDLVTLAHEDGRDVNVWTVDSTQQAKHLAAAGVDGIIADYSDLLAGASR
ncbi:glycerophosphodiester phosphodiesterase [Natrinema mahii]|nr:glycerophosphodiester phosphodiesterase [Natrinema mahii]